MSELVNIYIDSDIKASKGKGFYGYVLECKRDEKIVGTREEFKAVEDTRNRIFLKATVEAMGRITQHVEVHIYEPCGYVTGYASNGILDLWKLQNWIKGDNNEIKNRDLWEEIAKLQSKLNPQWHNGEHCYTEWIRSEIERRKVDETR